MSDNPLKTIQKKEEQLKKDEQKKREEAEKKIAAYKQSQDEALGNLPDKLTKEIKGAKTSIMEASEKELANQKKIFDKSAKSLEGISDKKIDELSDKVVSKVIRV